MTPITTYHQVANAVHQVLCTRSFPHCLLEGCEVCVTHLQLLGEFLYDKFAHETAFCCKPQFFRLNFLHYWTVGLQTPAVKMLCPQKNTSLYIFIKNNMSKCWSVKDLSCFFGLFQTCILVGYNKLVFHE